MKNLIIDDEYATISGDKTIVDASLVMKDKEIPDLVVLDKDNKVLGICADHDICINAVAAGKDPKTTKVVEAMYRIEPVGLDTPVEVAFQRMQQLKVTVVPVVEKDELKGVVTIQDCWGYIPEKYEDNFGLLTVKDPKFDNYWFTVFFALLYFIFGIVSPALGITGFLRSKISNASININTNVGYYLFDAHGTNYFQTYLNFPSNGIFWILISIYSVIFILIGLLTMIAVFQWAYGDFNMIKNTHSPHRALIIGIINMIIMWSLFLFMYATQTISPVRGTTTITNVSFDYVGFIFAIISIVCLIVAVFRDFAFKSAQGVPN